MRAHLREVFQDAEGDVLAGRTLTFYERDGTTPLQLSIYKTATGSATYTAPELVTNSLGQFEGWVLVPRRVQVAVSGVSGRTVTAFRGDDTDDTVRVTDAGAVADCVTTAGVASSVRNSTTITITGASLTSADEGKAIMLRDASGPLTSSTADITSGDATLTVDAPSFSSGMVGMIIQVEGAGAAGATLTTTILSFTSSTEVELATNASTTVSDNIAAWYHPVYSGTIDEVTSATTLTVTVAPTTTMSSVDVTIGTDNTLAIQDAIEALPTEGGIVEFPGGPSTVYGYAGTILLRSDLELRGRATLRRMSGDGNTFLTTPATPEDITITGLSFDQQHITSGKLLVVEPGSSRVTIEHCRMINNAPIGSFIHFEDGASQHNVVTFRRNRMERTLALQTYLGSATPENTNQIVISDANTVRVENNEFIRMGALYVQVIAASTTCRDWVVSGNRFLECPQTNLFVNHGDNGSTVVEQVEISRNRFLSGGLTVEKGAIEIGFGPTTCVMRNLVVANNNIRGMGYRGSSSGIATNNTPSMIHVGNGSFVDGVTIAGNNIDGASAAGANPAGANHGITVDHSVTRFTLEGNTVQRMGAAGIQICTQLAVDAVLNPSGIVHVAANPPIQGTITGNTCAFNALQTTSSQRESGIHVWYAKHLTISGNTCFRNGNNTFASNQAAGIAIASGDNANGVVSTIITITGNTATDIATATQKYGIRVGTPSASAADQPTIVTASHNITTGNAVGQVFSDTSNRTYSIYNNLGDDAPNAATFRTLTAVAQWNPADLAADGDATSTTITVTGAAVKDVVTASHESIDTAGLILQANVISANTVGVTLLNKTGGAKNVADGELRVVVRKY